MLVASPRFEPALNDLINPFAVGWFDGTSDRPFAGCVWVASRCRDLQCSAKLPREIVQSIEGFDLRERTLNLRVLGSIPRRLTTFLNKSTHRGLPAVN
jgi:hypothetical protein